MPSEKIQRVPLGLGPLLSTFGGVTPQSIEEAIKGTLDLLQFYGLTQLQTLGGSDAALAENSFVTITPSARNWTVLFGAQGSVTKTPTQTALRMETFVARTGGAAMLVSSESLGPFGATETGVVSFGGLLPYPILCPPGTRVLIYCAVLGTDATCNAVGVAEFGVLG